MKLSIFRYKYIRQSFYGFFVCAMCTNILLFIACASVGSPSKSVQYAGIPVPQFPFVEDAHAYAYVSDPTFITTIAHVFNIRNELILNRISTVSISITDKGAIAFVKMTKNTNISTIKKRIRLMKHIKAEPLDEIKSNWIFQNQSSRYLINVDYANVLVISTNADPRYIQTMKFIVGLSKELNILGASNDQAFWGRFSMDFFHETFRVLNVKNNHTFNEIIMDGDHAAIVIQSYDSTIDPSVDFAFQYNSPSNRMEEALFKLMVPFLFKSIDANVLASLPDISFKNNMVVIRGLRLPMKIIQPFISAVALSRQ